MVTFIKKKFEVEDPEASQTHRRGQALREGFDPGRSNIFFIGLRGSGKTTLARQVAEHLGAEFRDTDLLIRDRAGQSIADLVQSKGWDAFRDLEQSVLEELCAQSGQVVATGGGIVLRAQNRERLKQSGQVFYLMANPVLLASRLREQATDHRPELTELDLEQELRHTLQEREPLYYETLHFILQADQSVDELTDGVLTSLKLTNRAERGGESW